MCSFIQPKAAHTILEAIFAILVVLLAGDDFGKMLMPDGKENIGFDALSAGIGVLRHFVKDEGKRKGKRRGSRRVFILF